MKLAAVVVDDDSWWYLETSEENFKRVFWRLMQSHYFESTADTMGTANGKNAGSKSWMGR